MTLIASSLYTVHCTYLREHADNTSKEHRNRMKGGHKPLHEALSLGVPEDAALSSGAFSDQAPSTVDTCNNTAQHFKP